MRVGLCGVATVVVACTSAADRRPVVTVQDSAGVEIVRFPETLRDRLPQWQLVSEFDRGNAEGAPEEQFFRVTDVRVDHRGRLGVLNSGTGELRFFNASGEFEGSVGREGDGPGEFQRPTRLEALSDDTLVVFDVQLRRLSVIGPEGEAVRTIPLPGDLNYVRLVGVLPGGEFVLSSETIRAPTGREPSVNRARLLRMDRRGKPLGEVGEFRTRRWVRLDGNRITKPEFDPVTSFGVGDSLVWVAQGDGYEIRFYDKSGALRRVTRWSGPDRTVTEADRRRWSQEQSRWAETAEDRARIEQQLASTVYADQRAAYDVVVGSETGRLWVRDFDPWATEHRRWLVIDGDGRPEGVVATPVGFEVMEVGRDWAAGVTRDALGVPHVMKYRVVPADGVRNDS